MKIGPSVSQKILAISFQTPFFGGEEGEDPSNIIFCEFSEKLTGFVLKPEILFNFFARMEF